MRTRLLIASTCILLATATAIVRSADVPPDLEARLKPVLALEENAQFLEAAALCAELQKRYRDQPEALEALQAVAARIHDERRGVEDLGFAPSGLADVQCAAIAEERFKESGEAGRILLRKTFLTGSDELSKKAGTILLDLKDRQLSRLCAERIALKPNDPRRAEWLKTMWAAIAHVDPLGIPEFYTLTADPELARFLVAVVRRTGADSPETFARLTRDGAAYDLLKQRGLLSEPPTDALTVYFKFLEKSGERAENSAGEKHLAATVQGAKFVGGKTIGALAFTGNEMVTYNDKSLELGRLNADFTVALWLRLYSGPNNAWRNITHKGNSDEERTFAIWLHPDDNRMHYRIGTQANGNEGGDNPTEIPLGQWIHLTYVKRGRMLELYLDERKDAEAELITGTIHNTGPIYIGKDPWYAGIDGTIGDYRIYTRALLKSEIAILSKQAPE